MEKEKLDKMYDICFFDLDGTIIDSSQGITNSVMYALEKFGIEETEREKLYKFIGPPLTDSFARFYGFDDEKSWKAVEYYREYYQDTGIFECSVYPGFEKSLKALKAAGKRLFVATSKPEVYARRIIEHFDLDQYFEYVAGMELDGGRVDTNFLNEVVGFLGLKDKMNSMPSTLSGGQQQRVAIARALAARPTIVLADEPTGNLDSKTSVDVLSLMKTSSYKFHQTLVMITHNNEIAQLADHIIRIEDGKIVQ